MDAQRATAGASHITAIAIDFELPFSNSANDKLCLGARPQLPDALVSIEKRTLRQCWWPTRLTSWRPGPYRGAVDVYIIRARLLGGSVFQPILLPHAHLVLSAI